MKIPSQCAKVPYISLVDAIFKAVSDHGRFLEKLTTVGPFKTTGNIILEVLQKLAVIVLGKEKNDRRTDISPRVEAEQTRDKSERSRYSTDINHTPESKKNSHFNTGYIVYDDLPEKNPTEYTNVKVQVHVVANRYNPAGNYKGV